MTSWAGGNKNKKKAISEPNVLFEEISRFWIWVFLKSFWCQVKSSKRQHAQIGSRSHIHPQQKDLFWTSNPSYVSKISFSFLMKLIWIKFNLLLERGSVLKVSYLHSTQMAYNLPMLETIWRLVNCERTGKDKWRNAFIFGR